MTSNYMDKEKVDKYVDLLVDNLLKLQPKLQAQIKEAPELRTQLKDLLKLKFDIDGKGATVDVFREKNLIEIVSKYAQMAMTAAGITKQDPSIMKDIEKMLEPLFKDKNSKDDFMKKFQKLFEKQPNGKEFMKSLETLLKQTLGDDGFKKMMDQMNKILEKRDAAMEKCGLPKPAPSNNMVNLTGLLSNEPGSYFVPQVYFAGNGLAFVDYNPNNGIANIDTVNSVSNDAFGDPLGLINATVSNFAKIEDTVFNDFPNDLNAVGGLSPSMRGPLNTSLTPR